MDFLEDHDPYFDVTDEDLLEEVKEDEKSSSLVVASIDKEPKMLKLYWIGEPQILRLDYECHTLRLIADGKGNTFVVASDFGSPVVRKSNVSRLFSNLIELKHKFILVFQRRSTMFLTFEGVKHMLYSSRMFKSNLTYKSWVYRILLPVMQK